MSEKVKEKKGQFVCEKCWTGYIKRTICEKTLANIDTCDNPECDYEVISGFGR